MRRDLEWNEILAKIKKGDTFETETTDGSFYIKINAYLPYVCFSIHNGHRFSDDLKNNCLLNEDERWYEEDPHTYELISSMPIVISANDSRYAYDLNRTPGNAIYETAWGKKVWKQPLTGEQVQLNLNKHQRFYQLVDILVHTLESRFNAVLVFDIHSYNYRRLQKSTPVFNLGTALVQKDRYNKTILFWLKELRKIKLRNLEITVAENEVFEGKGYLLEYITTHFPKTLVLATEIKKIYCNESTGEVYPVLIDRLAHLLKRAIVNTADQFIREHSKFIYIKKQQLLPSEISKAVLKFDKELFDTASRFEILNYVNPVNIEQAKKEFFKSKYTQNPKFIYKPLSINPFEFKRKLYSTNVEIIPDISLRMLYQDVIDAYADKVDLIASIGTDKFLYNSLRYFGEPGLHDINNANYILHCSSSIDTDYELNLLPEDVLQHFRQVLNDYGFQCKLEISRQIISTVLILNNKRTIRIRKDALFSKNLLNALSEHEIGVHMLTTVNSRLQPLAVFRLGTPINTHTQEGLAIMSEYLSGNMSIRRMQILALRVLTIEKLLKGFDFKQTFQYIMDLKKIDEQQAFYMTARIYRGGGFTKDYLYLTGFKDIYKRYRENTNLTNLLIGKTSVKYLNVINEMVERKIFQPPRYVTRSFQQPSPTNSVIDYILMGLV